ncbi:MAG: hypothetical protein ACN6PV_00085 [Achromobacter sp.]|uniref:hypothetical protein n=1 Tax=Achromobacter sp. TaxID=134375 RepID=UPI003CFCA8E4
MNNEISPRQDSPTNPATDMTPCRPRSGFKKWAAAMLSLVKRAEKKIVENFRVPPNGA